jgi:uncharacterized protein (TIGR03437 family)
MPVATPSSIPRGLARCVLAVVLLAPLAYAQDPQLGPAPRIEQPPLSTAPRSTAFPQAAGGWVDTTNREAVRQLYLNGYTPLQNFPMGWTGNLAAGKAGDTSMAYKNTVIQLVNFFRSLAGVPPIITLDLVTSPKAQLAALMFAANSQLSHMPPTNWIDYSADGADAAGHSNICLDTSLPLQPGCVEGYVNDSGSNNTEVGHRRWIFYPQTTRMGTGDIPPGDQAHPYGANDLWVINLDEFGGPRPATRQEFVAWPPPGYVPQQLVYSRWSFAYHDADLTGATVAMTRNGSAVPFQLQTVQNGFGENTVVWEVQGGVIAPHAVAATADVSTHVTVGNVIINGAAQQFSYDVTAFDPSVASAPAVSSGGVKSAASYQANGVSPGEILAVFGTSLGPAKIVTLTLDQNGRVATTLGPTRVLFDGVPGPMIYTLNSQVSAIAPFSIAGKQNVNVQVEVNGVASAGVSLPVVASKPAIFSDDQSGKGQGAILNHDFSVNSASKPAAPGSVVQIFMTGGGVLTPPGQDGELAPSTSLLHLAASVSAKIGGIDAVVKFSGAAPFLVLGVVQVNVLVPAGVPSGNASLEVTIGGVSSQPGVTVAIK